MTGDAVAFTQCAFVQYPTKGSIAGSLRNSAGMKQKLAAVKRENPPV